MKGVSFLVNDEGKKTHVVLDLRVWEAVWQTLKQTSLQPDLTKTRQPGGLNTLLLQRGLTKQDIEKMNEHLSTEALKPLTEGELGLSEVV